MSFPLLRSNTRHLLRVVYQYTQRDSLFNDFVVAGGIGGARESVGTDRAADGGICEPVLVPKGVPAGGVERDADPCRRFAEGAVSRQCSAPVRRRAERSRTRWQPDQSDPAFDGGAPDSPSSCERGGAECEGASAPASVYSLADGASAGFGQIAYPALKVPDAYDAAVRPWIRRAADQPNRDPDSPVLPGPPTCESSSVTTGARTA